MGVARRRIIASVAALSGLVAADASAFSTNPEISVTRSFSAMAIDAGGTITVTLEVAIGAVGASPLRGFFIAEPVPDALTPSNVQITLNGGNVAASSETSASGAVYPGCRSARWVFEKPPSWSENNPVSASSTIAISYELTIPSSMPSGSLTFPGSSWVVMIPSAGDGGDHFGYEDGASTVTVVGQPQLALSPASLAFSIEEGAGDPADQTVAVSNTGGGNLAAVTTDVTYGSGSGWLTVAASGSENTQTLTTSVSTAGLQPNSYSAVVAVSAAGAANTPQSYTVSLTIVAKPSTTQPTILLDPTSVQLSAEQDGAGPSQAVAVTNSGAETLAPVSTAISYVTGSGWLTVTATGAGNSQSLDNAASPAGLSPDTYAATVEVSSAGASNTPQNYTVFFTVTPAQGDDGGVDAGGDGGVDANHDAAGDAASETELDGSCAIGGADASTGAGLLLALALLWTRRYHRRTPTPRRVQAPRAALALILRRVRR